MRNIGMLNQQLAVPDECDARASKLSAEPSVLSLEPRQLAKHRLGGFIEWSGGHIQEIAAGLVASRAGSGLLEHVRSMGASPGKIAGLRTA